MKTSSSILLLIILMIMATPFSVYADRDRGDHQRGWDRQQKWDRQKDWDKNQRKDFREEGKIFGHPDYRFNRQLEPKRHYPKEGLKIRVLPKKRHVIHYHDHNYFYWDGIWYSSIGAEFVVIRPPLGIIVPILPAFYTTIWFGDIPYYYANDVYYVWRDDLNGYEVVEFPDDNEAKAAISYKADKLFVYPKKGQSKQQQADDEYACHRYGVEQTGYDPTQPASKDSANASQKQLSEQRQDYQRAMKSCLEARDYSVQ